MATYLVGDIHGCYTSLKNILNQVSFNPKKDILWLTGDLVAKGPSSLKVLNLVYNIKNNVRIVLGNHDLYLLKLHSNLNYHTQTTQHTDTTSILQSPHFNKLITWLRHQPIMQIDEEKKIIMTHAGINPMWNIRTTKKYAKEIENILRNKDYNILLNNIYSTKNYDAQALNMNLQDLTRIQFNINVFTKMRYLLPNGGLDLEHKDSPKTTPKPLQPWFNVPRLIPPEYNIIFGHWSKLQGKGTPPGIYGLDSGCYQGKKLTLLEWEKKKFTYVSCHHDTL